MSRLNRFTSFLDRFEEQLEVDCDKLKHELVGKVDRQFGALKAKLKELKSNIGGRTGGGVLVRSGLLNDDPKVENVSLEEWQHKQQAAEQQSDMPSTSYGRKRASHSQTGPFTSTKKRKSNPSDTNQTKKFVCKFKRCGQWFHCDSALMKHERTHLDIKPYSCAWANCGYSSEQRNNIVVHVRMKHFKLPKTRKEQQRLNIVDNRDPNDYVQVDNQLVELE